MKKLLIFALTVIMCISAFASCEFGNIDTPPDNITPTPPSDGSQTIIWANGVEVAIVIEDSLDSLSEKYFDADAITSALNNITSGKVLLNTASTAPEKTTNELLIGETGRSVSDNAYSRLASELYIDGVNEYDGWLIYAEDGSLALAYTNEYGMRMAVKYLSENLLTGELSAKNGTVASDKYEYKTRVDEVREAVREAEFDALEAQGVDPEIVTALRKLYSLYNANTYLWMADLYDPEIGGFYFSNSARNNEGFLPDIESTVQILRFLGTSGIFDDFGGNYANGISSEMKNDLIKFAKSLQSSENGYFYHPQWGKNNENVATSHYDARLGRDLNWATSLLKELGAKPDYNAPDGTLGELGAPGATPASALTSPFGSSVAISVSKLTASTVTATASYLPAHLQSMKNWRNYITELFAKNSSYEAGNTLAAQQGQIKNAGEQYMDYLIAYLDEKQNPSTGLWESPVNYDSVNGLMKLGSVYNYFNAPIPNADKAMKSTIEVALQETGDSHVCSVYNPWVAMSLLIDSSEEIDKKEGTSVAEELRAIVYENAKDLILITYNKLEKYYISTGGFHYHSTLLQHTSQGAPVACAKEFEADVNGTAICITGISGNIFEALGLDMVSIYCHEDYIQFNDKISNLAPVIKNPPIPIPGVTGDRGAGAYYNSEAEGKRYNFTISTGEQEWIETKNWSRISEGIEHVGGADKAAYFFRPEDSAEYPRLYANYYGDNATSALTDHMMVVEFDMAFKNAPKDAGAEVFRYEFFYGKIKGADTRVHISLTTDADGRVVFRNTAAHTSESWAPMKQDLWYNLRFEIYQDANVKVFINNEYALTLAGEIKVSSVSTRVNFNIVNPVDGTTGFVLDNLYIGAESKKFVSEDPDYVEIKIPEVTGSVGSGIYYNSTASNGKKFDFTSQTLQTEYIEVPTWSNITEGIKLTGFENNSVYIYRPNDTATRTYARYDAPNVTTPLENHIMVVEQDIAFTGLAAGQTAAYRFDFIFGNKDGANSRFNIYIGSDANGDIVFENTASHTAATYTPLKQNTIYNLRFELYANGYAKVYVNNTYAFTLEGAILENPSTNTTRVNFNIQTPTDDNHGFILDNLFIGYDSKVYVSESN